MRPLSLPPQNPHAPHQTITKLLTVLGLVIGHDSTVIDLFYYRKMVEGGTKHFTLMKGYIFCEWLRTLKDRIFFKEIWLK